MLLERDLAADLLDARKEIAAIRQRAETAELELQCCVRYETGPHVHPKPPVAPVEAICRPEVAKGWTEETLSTAMGDDYFESKLSVTQKETWRRLARIALSRPQPTPERREAALDYSQLPRRIRLEKFSIGERAIWDATQIVEAMGAHPHLTDAVVLLGKAREAVADFVDESALREGGERG